MNVAFGERTSDTRMTLLDLPDHFVEFSEVSSRGRRRIRGVKSRVENCAGDGGIACLETRPGRGA